MQEIRRTTREAAEDVFFGQVAINWVRWFVIAAGVVMALGAADNTNAFVLGILPVVVFIATNFYLHGRYLAQRPANSALIGAASLVDIAVITGIVALWPGAEQRGLLSPFFIMHYPVVLAFAFVMPRMAAVAYTLVALAAYTGTCLVANASIFTLPAEMGGGLNVDAVEGLVARLIVLAAMGALGTYYWRVQRNRRHNAMTSGEHGA